MKKYYKFYNTWSKEQVMILHQFGIDVEEGFCRIDISEDDITPALQAYIDQWDMEYVGKYCTFSDQDILSAKYCLITGGNSCGYPMPESAGPRYYNVFEESPMCTKCGVELVQKADFRMRKVPKCTFVRFIDIPDVFFVRTDLYEKIFKPLGIGCRPVRVNRNNEIMPEYVQLIIPVIDEPLDLSDYTTEICPVCGVTKYHAQVHDFFPIQKHPLPHIYQSKEFFGSGFLAFRKTFVSAYLRDLMIENKMMRLYFFDPCQDPDAD